MRPPRSHLSPLLVGRDEILANAEHRLEAAAGGHGSTLLVAGEAGIGKTRLLGAIVRKARAAGFRIAKGDIAPGDREVPLASVLDLARTMRQDPALRDLGDRLLATRGSRGGDSMGSRRLLVREVSGVIVDALEGPTVLAFEDLQWADELSLEVVAELARAAEGRPLLVLAAYRADELPRESIHREWRARLISQRLADEVRLEPLTYEQTALVTSLILGADLPAPREVVKAIYERTDGVPLYVEELLGALGDDARSDGHAIRNVQVPDTIEAAVLARAARLSQQARAVAAAGAVIGRCFVPEVLAGIMDRAVTELEPAFDELVRDGFLYPFDHVDRGYYDFRHQLLRDSLYATVPPQVLRRLHARAAEFGAQLAGASEIHASIHFERAGLRAQAFRAALAGAEAAAALSSRREAFELYRRAVANLPADLGAAEVGAVFRGLAEAALAVDDVPAAADAAERARRAYLEAGMQLEAADMVIVQSIVDRRDTRPIADQERRLADAERALDALPDTPARRQVLAGVREFQGHVALDAGRVNEARRLFGDSIRLRGKVDLTASLDAEAHRALCDVADGDLGGIDLMLDVARRAREANLENTAVTAYRLAAAFAVGAMDHHTAVAGLDEGLRYADEIEQSYCRRILAATAAHLAWAAGRWDEATATAELELVEPGSRRSSVAARNAIAYVALGRGELGRARSLLLESLAIGWPRGEAELVLPALWGLAETALLDGHAQEALGRCEEALELARKRSQRWLLVPFVVTGVRAALVDRRPEAAETWRTQVAALVPVDSAAASTALAHADGLIRLASGAPGAARAALEAAVSGWEAHGRTWEAAWARIDLARCLIRSGRHVHALPVLRAVRDTAEHIRSTLLLDEVATIERQARGRAASAEPWAPLTTREFEVARHIAGGLTNKDVAAELGVAPRTVSAHVEHILAKLGVSRRAEIAAWAASVDARAASAGGRAASSDAVAAVAR